MKFKDVARRVTNADAAAIFYERLLVLCKEIFNAVEFIGVWLEVSAQPGAAASRAASGR